MTAILLCPWFRPSSRPWVCSTPYRDSSSPWQSSQSSSCYQSSQTAGCSLSSQASSRSPSCGGSLLQKQTSHTEAFYQSSQIYSLRKHPEPPAYQSIQPLCVSQREATETAASLSHRDTVSHQIPGRLFEHPAAPWRK